MSEAEPAKGRPRSTSSAYIQNTILLGVLTAAPLVVTWFILQFMFDLIAAVGRPVIQVLAEALGVSYPSVAHWISRPSIEDGLAVLFVIVGLFLLGFFARQVIGDRILKVFNALIGRIPFANKIYGALSQLVGTLQKAPDGVQRVVLIDFPNSEVKAVGIVTRTMRDRYTGEELAAVFIPTTPNPTAGYLEIVPIDRLTPLGMSMDDAVSFVVSGGAVGPEIFNYSNGAVTTRPTVTGS
jgi:uncharacterized membrane protein